MKKRIKHNCAYLPAWLFYWLGHFVSVLMFKKYLKWLYPSYSLLMNWSLFFNDWGDLTVWLDDE